MATPSLHGLAELQRNSALLTKINFGNCDPVRAFFILPGHSNALLSQAAGPPPTDSHTQSHSIQTPIDLDLVGWRWIERRLALRL